MRAIVPAWLPIPWISLRCDERAVKIIERIPKNRPEVEKLEILHRDLPRFDLCEPATCAIPATHLKSRRELILRPTLLVAQFPDRRTDCVFWRDARHPSRWRLGSQSSRFAPDAVQECGMPFSENDCGGSRFPSLSCPRERPTILRPAWRKGRRSDPHHVSRSLPRDGGSGTGRFCSIASCAARKCSASDCGNMGGTGPACRLAGSSNQSATSRGSCSGASQRVSSRRRPNSHFRTTESPPRLRKTTAKA